ncbi:MAG: hypothetical protein ACI4F7_02770 [Acutalibacteraceae bacterium]
MIKFLLGLLCGGVIGTVMSSLASAARNRDVKFQHAENESDNKE